MRAGVVGIDVGRLEDELMQMSAEGAPGREFCEAISELAATGRFVEAETIYRLALETTQIPGEECCFIDDRSLNLECAAKLGMRTIEMQTLEQLRTDLGKLGVEA